MKTFIGNGFLWMVLLTLSFSPGSYAQSKAVEDPLGKKLDDLRIPDDTVSSVLSEDQLYVVNTRYSSLKNRHELTLRGAHNFNSDGHLKVQQGAATYRYHLNASWSFGLIYTRYNNELTREGRTLLNDEQILPDTDYAINAQEIFASYNTIYGKLRWSRERVVYFDQYIALGLGQVELASGKTNNVFLDLGVAFWLGKQASVRFGLKNEGYNRILRREGEQFQYNALGYVEIGLLFGRGDRK